MKPQEKYQQETGNDPTYYDEYDGNKLKYMTDYTKWLEAKFTSHNSSSCGSADATPKSRLICDSCCNSCRSDIYITECDEYEEAWLRITANVVGNVYENYWTN